MNRGHKIRSLVVKQVLKGMIIVLTRVKVWKLGSTLLPTMSILQTIHHFLPPLALPIHLPLTLRAEATFSLCELVFEKQPLLTTGQFSIVHVQNSSHDSYAKLIASSVVKCRPANSHGSAMSLTVFYLFSRPHDKTPQSHDFWGKIILKWNISCKIKKWKIYGKLVT